MNMCVCGCMLTYAPMKAYVRVRVRARACVYVCVCVHVCVRARARVWGGHIKSAFADVRRP